MNTDISAIHVITQDGPTVAIGTIWTDDGSAKAYWNTTETAVHLTDDAFNSLCASLTAPVFSRYAVSDPDARQRYDQKYLIIVTGSDQTADDRGFLIPFSERDPQWVAWLRIVDATRQPG